jgi:hypothetical protein
VNLKPVLLVERNALKVFLSLRTPLRSNTIILVLMARSSMELEITLGSEFCIANNSYEAIQLCRMV